MQIGWKIGIGNVPENAATGAIKLCLDAAIQCHPRPWIKVLPMSPAAQFYTVRFAQTLWYEI
jgi:hypothetical protein